MIVGESSYVDEIYKMALGSNGAVSIEYLMSIDGDSVFRINEIMDIHNG